MDIIIGNINIKLICVDCNFDTFFLPKQFNIGYLNNYKPFNTIPPPPAIKTIIVVYKWINI